MSPLNWLNLALIAVIVVAGMTVSAREDVSSSTTFPLELPLPGPVPS